MRKLLFNLFKNLFKSEISNLVSYHSQKEVSRFQLEKKQKKDFINYPVGTKVIIVGNEPTDKLTIAEVVGHQVITKQEIIVPTFYNDDIGEFLSMGIIHLWSQEKEDVLNKLTWDERYNLLTNGFYSLSKKHIKKKRKVYEKENTL